MKNPKLEILAKELETIEKVRENSHFLIDHARDDKYPRMKLIEELTAEECKFFAVKLLSGYYDRKHNA